MQNDFKLHYLESDASKLGVLMAPLLVELWVFGHTERSGFALLCVRSEEERYGKKGLLVQGFGSFWGHGDHGMPQRSLEYSVQSSYLERDELPCLCCLCLCCCCYCSHSCTLYLPKVRGWVVHLTYDIDVCLIICSCCRSRVLPPLSFPLLRKIGLLGLIGWVHARNDFDYPLI